MYAHMTVDEWVWKRQLEDALLQSPKLSVSLLNETKQLLLADTSDASQDATQAMYALLCAVFSVSMTRLLL
jgi:hypothetical protein